MKQCVYVNVSTAYTVFKGGTWRTLTRMGINSVYLRMYSTEQSTNCLCVIYLARVVENLQCSRQTQAVDIAQVMTACSGCTTQHIYCSVMLWSLRNTYSFSPSSMCSVKTESAKVSSNPWLTSEQWVLVSDLRAFAFHNTVTSACSILSFFWNRISPDFSVLQEDF